MIKKLMIAMLICLTSVPSKALSTDFAKYFHVDMKMELPDLEHYLQKLDDDSQIFDRGYTSRFKIKRNFNHEFSKAIKFYGLSEKRIKSDYEDELLEALSWLPKEAYPYIGPMLHDIPGMSEKILNMPGIKETKNQFPPIIDEKFKDIENIENMSPGLYILLMPNLWKNNNPEKANNIPIKKKKVKIELPAFLQLKHDETAPLAIKNKQFVINKAEQQSSNSNFHSKRPTVSSLLTSDDVETFTATIDDVIAWGNENNMERYAQMILGETLLNFWESEQQANNFQNDLKDVVNPCQRLVLKTRFSGLYAEFAYLVAKKGFTPEEWAYTCDKTIKAFRVAEADINTAYAVQFHRRGYYHQYIDKLPKKWQDNMYAMETAIIMMYTALKEDVETVAPYAKELREKFNRVQGIMLTEPIIY